MRYGFTKGAFTVVDDARRIGEFAYASSPYWVKAKRTPEATAKLMLANAWSECPMRIREAHYLLSCQALDEVAVGS